MQEERRKYERFPVKIPARVEDTDEQAIVRDMSAGGIAVITVIDLAEGSLVELNFLAKGHNVRFDGKIQVKLQKDEKLTYGIMFFKHRINATTKLVKHRKSIELLEMKSKK